MEKKKMPRKKSKKNMYFDMDVQDAIVRYNLSEDDNERNKIGYKKKKNILMKPLNKEKHQTKILKI